MDITTRLRQASASAQHEYVVNEACEIEPTDEHIGIVLPGQVIDSASGAFLRGHGAYFGNQELIASVAGVVDRVNQLISVRPIASRYSGEVGDIVVENDLISAEIQEVRYDGTLTLHTRSLRYGKLENGQLVCVSPALVKRMKQHMITLGEDLNIDVIIGTNGYMWVTRSMQEDTGFNLQDKHFAASSNSPP
ncbi:hypothetical protein ABG067_002122 [Albugo candida]